MEQSGAVSLIGLTMQIEEHSLSADADWAYSRLRELSAEKDQLSQQEGITGEAPQIDAKTMAYRMNTNKILAAGTYAEKKRLIRSCVYKITIAPDTLEVEISYKIPEAIGEYGGSGGALRRYLQPISIVNDKEMEVNKEWKA